MHAWLRRLCPESCPRCGFASQDGFCRDCRREFARLDSCCSRCGLPYPCRPCPAATPGWHVDAVHAPFAYRIAIAQCLKRLKYRRERHLGRALGRLLGDELEASTSRIDALVAVPLHRQRLRSRTFNQADEICRALAKQSGIPMLAAGIRRTLDTGPQTALGRAGRLGSPERAFRVDLALTGWRIAIVDDVITTGATVNALGRELKAAGAVRVEAWSVARSVNP